MEATVAIHPLHCPLRLLSNDINFVHCVEEVMLLVLVLDVGINQQRVGLGVDVLHCNLEPVEAPGFRDLHLAAELLGQVLQHDPVRGCKEGQHILYEVLLICSQLEPVLAVLGEVNLVRCPETGHLLLVHLEHRQVLDGKQHEPLRVFSEDGLGLFGEGEGGVLGGTLGHVHDENDYSLCYLNRDFG